ncbi:hypothetical protein EDC04DRAFT_3093144 [Pisolithus marmoratus]|nr:hypothetical protein EDC04DRAFT_3093144 [Pisolithus marmoratus]
MTLHHPLDDTGNNLVGTSYRSISWMWLPLEQGNSYNTFWSGLDDQVYLRTLRHRPPYIRFETLLEDDNSPEGPIEVRFWIYLRSGAAMFANGSGSVPAGVSDAIGQSGAGNKEREMVNLGAKVERGIVCTYASLFPHIALYTVLRRTLSATTARYILSMHSTRKTYTVRGANAFVTTSRANAPVGILSWFAARFILYWPLFVPDVMRCQGQLERES